MSWTCAVLLACCSALAWGLPEEADRHFQASEEYLHRQKHILQLFLRPLEPNFQDFVEISKNYNIEQHADKYKDPDCVSRFLEYKKSGVMFPRAHIPFNPFSERCVKSIQLAFDLLFYANDFDIFIATAVYLKKTIHKGVFNNALMTVLEAREDTRSFYVPPRYEVYPYVFVDERVIQDAMDAKIKGLQSGNHEKIVILSNYTGYWDASLDRETSVYYFTEDVGLNALNVEFSRRFPVWWDSKKYQQSYDRKGELFLHYQRQLLARYFLERLSNNLGDIPYISEDTPLPAYFPRLRYVDGQQVPPRQPFTFIRETKESWLKSIHLLTLQLWWNIDAGYAFIANDSRISLKYPKGLDILGDLVYFYGDSPDKELYGSYINTMLYRLGRTADPEEKYGLAPSTFMRPDTTLRDPLFYSFMDGFFKNFYYRYLEKQHKYTYADVSVPGLTIENLAVDDLITYFEDFDMSLFDAYDLMLEKDKKIDIYARLRRLNHQPFNYKVAVSSDKEMDVVVKVFITPKYDRQGRLIPLNDRIFYAFEIDRFITKVPAGKSNIERKSEESTVAVNDAPSLSEMWSKIQDALENKKPLNVDQYARPYGFPQRLLLPKGNKYGMPVQLVVAMYPYQQADTTDRRAYNLESFPLLGTSYDVKFPDSMPIDYPADRLYRSEHDASVPNVFSKEVLIYHKTLEEINSVRSA